MTKAVGWFLPLLLCAGCQTPGEATWQAMHLVDGLQTLSIAKDPCFYEKDPITRRIIGRNPSEADVVIWWAGTAVAHAWVSRRLERRERLYTIWQAVSLGSKGFTIGRNHSIGIRPFRTASACTLSDRL